ncbi:MAG: hypothetical protein E7395_07760 [Ruminococcaceae bacterium]|nr:hypothetical protein [Oscillospiraceae bacterium]
MKVFVLKGKSVLFYTIMLLAASVIIFSKWDSASMVFNQNSDLRGLPIYCVDKGEEKVCAISFDAAWDASKSATKYIGLIAL